MPPVTVTALKAFEHNGRMVAPGDPVEVDPPVNALPLARQGLVSLSTRVQTRDLKAADPDPEPEPEPEAPRQKRRYRRRDMQAETE